MLLLFQPVESVQGCSGSPLIMPVLASLYVSYIHVVHTSILLDLLCVSQLLFICIILPLH